MLTPRFGFVLSNTLELLVGTIVSVFVFATLDGGGAVVLDALVKDGPPGLIERALIVLTNAHEQGSSGPPS